VKKAVFVDGQYGTTGLKIRERLAGRTDIEPIDLPEDKRKDTAARREALNRADIVFLCLPDDAARESVGLIDNPAVCVIDGSTAHRVTPGWVYGLPEMNSGQRAFIKASSRITVPGCHATGFVAMLYPLVSGGIVPPDYPVTCHTTAGYSGGGKSMIAAYEDPASPDYIRTPRLYALTLNHKHVPEMTQVVGLARPLTFSPTVVDVYRGEIVSVPLVVPYLSKNLGPSDIRAYLADYYDGERFIRVMPFPADDYLKSGYLTFTDCNDTNYLDIFVFGSEERVLLAARFDNLGKGASGAAVQNMNIVLGIPEETGLV
jgi:N-acetyl-gamma-glutamyl-phosphate reductase